MQTGCSCSKGDALLRERAPAPVGKSARQPPLQRPAREADTVENLGAGQVLSHLWQPQPTRHQVAPADLNANVDNMYAAAVTTAHCRGVCANSNLSRFACTGEAAAAELGERTAVPRRAGASEQRRAPGAPCAQPGAPPRQPGGTSWRNATSPPPPRRPGGGTPPAPRQTLRPRRLPHASPSPRPCAVRARRWQRAQGAAAATSGGTGLPVART